MKKNKKKKTKKNNVSVKNNKITKDTQRPDKKEAGKAVKPVKAEKAEAVKATQKEKKGKAQQAKDTKPQQVTSGKTCKEKDKKTVKKTHDIEIVEITEDIIEDNSVTKDTQRAETHKEKKQENIDIKNKKDEEEVKARKKKRKKTWKEQICTCPYLIIVAATSLAAMVCSDEIGIRAAAREAQAMALETMGKSVPTQEYASDPVTEYAPESGEILQQEAELEKEDGNITDKLENAGECKGTSDGKISEDELDNESEEEEEADNTEEIPIGITRFETYEPQATDSIYYSDAGKIALTTEYPYAKENESYFKNAAFLGDSRTLGISDYAGLDGADFYCDSGMTIFKLLGEDGVTYQKTGDKVNIPQVLQQKQYGKIYMMLGMNELGYGNTEMYLKQYREVVEQIRTWQPGAIIYIMANLHVSKEKNNLETEFNNMNINAKNAASATLANGTDIFYLDANPLFTDEEGCLNAEMSFDGVHLYAQHYDAWREFLLEHAVEPVEVQ